MLTECARGGRRETGKPFEVGEGRGRFRVCDRRLRVAGFLTSSTGWQERFSEPEQASIERQASLILAQKICVQFRYIFECPVSYGSETFSAFSDDRFGECECVHGRSSCLVLIETFMSPPLYSVSGEDAGGLSSLSYFPIETFTTCGAIVSVGIGYIPDRFSEWAEHQIQLFPGSKVVLLRLLDQTDEVPWINLICQKLL